MSLNGHRVLIIEDEPLIALDLEGAVLQLRAQVAGLATTVEDALRGAADPAVTAAIVDLRLGGQSVREAIAALVKRGVPFVFYSGMEDTPTGGSWPAVPLLQKPLPPETVAKALANAARSPRIRTH